MNRNKTGAVNLRLVTHIPLYPAFDFQPLTRSASSRETARTVCPETPDMSFRIARRINTVAIKLIRRLARDDGALGPRAGAMFVDAFA